MSKKSKFTGRRKSTGKPVSEDHMEVATTEQEEHDTVEVDNGAPANPEPDSGTGEDGSPAGGNGEEPAKQSSSVVAAKFKDRYIAAAREHGIKGKAARRSNWDWLSQRIAAECLTKDKLNIDRFLVLLEANGIDHSQWTNRSRGWEGRLRMTGRVALQRIVADRKALVVGGETLVPPEEFVEKYKTKA